MPAKRFGGKTYDQIYGADRGNEIKEARSQTMKAFHSSNPGRLKGANNPKAKTYEVTSPTGEKYIVTGGLQEFSEQHGLTYCCMADTARGSQKQHKGWKVILARF